MLTKTEQVLFETFNSEFAVCGGVAEVTLRGDGTRCFFGLRLTQISADYWEW
jgi:hypothetical protein